MFVERRKRFDLGSGFLSSRSRKPAFEPDTFLFGHGSRLLVAEESLRFKQGSLCQFLEKSGCALETLDVSTVAEWRSWLDKHHLTIAEIWLVFHRQGSGVPSISYADALDEALAYGWIDSVIRKLDEEKYVRKFTPRKPRSIWSSLNIGHVNRLRKEGRMTKWGLEAFEKRTGEISQLEKITAAGIRIPSDLTETLKKNKTAWDNFQSFAPSHKKRYLIWISAAKRPETRKKRIDEAVVLISRNVKNLLK